MYQYGGMGSAGSTLDRLSSIAGFSNGSAWMPRYSAGEAAQYRNAQTMLPYEAQMDIARMRMEGQNENDLELQRRNALKDQYGARQKYYYEYGI